MAVTPFGHKEIAAQKIKHQKLHWINQGSWRTCSHNNYTKTRKWSHSYSNISNHENCGVSRFAFQSNLTVLKNYITVLWSLHYCDGLWSDCFRTFINLARAYSRPLLGVTITLNLVPEYWKYVVISNG